MKPLHDAVSGVGKGRDEDQREEAAREQSQVFLSPSNWIRLGNDQRQAMETEYIRTWPGHAPKHRGAYALQRHLQTERMQQASAAGSGSPACPRSGAGESESCSQQHSAQHQGGKIGGVQLRQSEHLARKRPWHHLRQSTQGLARDKGGGQDDSTCYEAAEAWAAGGSGEGSKRTQHGRHRHPSWLGDVARKNMRSAAVAEEPRDAGRRESSLHEADTTSRLGDEVEVGCRVRVIWGGSIRQTYGARTGGPTRQCKLYQYIG